MTADYVRNVVRNSTIALRGYARALGLSLLMLGTTAVVVAAPQNGGERRATAAAIEAGHGTFRQFCAPCHGASARGDGPIAPMLITRPADLALESRHHNGVFPLAALEEMLTLSARLQPAHGSEQMPIWGPVFLAIDSNPTLARARIVNLLAYLESIQQ